VTVHITVEGVFVLIGVVAVAIMLVRILYAIVLLFLWGKR
jgi:hypothetical protein